MTHTREPVPLVVFRSAAPPRNPRVRGFSERVGHEGEVGFPKGDELMKWFLSACKQRMEDGKAKFEHV